MAIAKTQMLTNKSSTNASSYSTTPTTLTAVVNRLYVIGVMLYGSGSTPLATVSGGGLTSWTKSVEATNASNVCISIHYALMTSSPGAAAAVVMSASGACTGAAWECEEFTGMATTGTNGADAIGVSATNKGTATSGTVTLGALAGSTSAVYGAFAIDSNEAMNPGGTYSELIEQQATTEGDTFEAIYQLPGTTTPNTAWSSNVVWAGAAIEIKEAGGASAPPFFGARSMQGAVRGYTTGGRHAHSGSNRHSHLVCGHSGRRASAHSPLHGGGSGKGILDLAASLGIYTRGAGQILRPEYLERGGLVRAAFR